MKYLIIIFLVSLLFYGCPPDFDGDDGCLHYRYYFSLPVSFVPADSIIKVGDTITISCQFSKKLRDEKYSELFNFDSIDFKDHCQFIKVDTIISLQDRFNFLNDFDLFADSIYNLRLGKTIVKYNYYYDGTTYFLKFKIVPKCKGVYIFELFSYRNASSFDWDDSYIYVEGGDCKTNRWYPYFITNEGRAYRELLKYSPNDYYKEKAGFYFFPERDGAHCFKVE